MTSSIATNSAPRITNSPAADRKARISHSTECTGFRAITVKSAPAIVGIAKR